MVSRDVALKYKWEPYRGKCICCNCNRIEDGLNYYHAGERRLSTCTNLDTSWCALCEDCGKGLGVVW